ncbi:hypothetical protein ACFWGN_16180 [Oerskovia sp. NPDC060338]|uniref:hypothetical protein n=1 Tax=Oerskovia sp. NPDC060338 TaxID=3347100 RepID=UPI00364964FA
MDLDKLIAQAREKINARINLRNQYAQELDALRGKTEPTADDKTKTEELRGKKAGIDTELVTLDEELRALEDEKKADDVLARLAERVTPVDTGTGARAGERPAESRAGSGFEVREGRAYSRDSDPNGRQFLRDVALDFLRIRGEHSQRLAAHEQEERTVRGDQIEVRGVTTGGAPGLVVPQYLVDLYAAKGRAGRKFADQCRRHNLPETGMTAYIPRQTAKTIVGNQAAELTPAGNNDYANEDIAVPIRTAAGSQNISRQSVERGLGTEDIVFEDLLKAFDVNLDSTIINASTWGLLAVANTITYTDADPTAAELYRKILGAGANVEDVLLDLDEDDLLTLMRGRRWSWLQGEMSDKWPFIAAQGVPALAGGTSNGSGYPAGVRGRLPNGGDVVTDNNLPNGLGTGANEDVAVVVARQEAHLWEDPSAPMYIRAETGPSMNNLGIDLVVYGYYAACFNRVVDEQGAPKAVHQKITGTGLVAPVF